MQGDKNKKRKAAASAAPTLMSPVNPPPSEPRQHRPAAAAAALAIKQSALDGDAADALTFFAGLDAEHHRRMDWARHYVLNSLGKMGRMAAAAAAVMVRLRGCFCCFSAAGHRNFGVLLGALGGNSGQINAVRVVFIHYKPIKNSLNRIRGSPKTQLLEHRKRTVDLTLSRCGSRAKQVRSASKPSSRMRSAIG